MKTGKITIGGKEHTLAFTVRAASACSERFGGIEKIGDVLEAPDALGQIAWLLALLCDCGRRYDEKEGNPVPDAPVPTEDDILDGMDVKELTAAAKTIMTTISGGSKPTVKAVAPKGSPKNAKATRRT